MFFDNTASVKQLAARGIPEIPRGTETYNFSVGQNVKSSGLGKYFAGVEMTIASRYMQHGYAYYVDERGTTHRQKDLLSVN